MNALLENEVDNPKLQILHAPAGYVDGVNRYEFVNDNPIKGLDPTGLYDITWHKGSNWSDAEKKRINDSLMRMESLVEKMIREIDELIIIDLPSRKCNMSSLIAELEKLREVLSNVHHNLKSALYPHRFIKSNYKNPDSPLEWIPHTFKQNDINFNMTATKTWDQIPDGELDERLFHELSHEYGTYDNDDNGSMLNPNNYEKLITIVKEKKKLADWVLIRGKIMNIELACAKATAAPPKTTISAPPQPGR
jgi:hypothetical protein